MKSTQRLARFRPPTVRTAVFRAIPSEDTSLTLASATNLVPTRASLRKLTSVGLASADEGSQMPTLPMVVHHNRHPTIARRLATLPQQRQFPMTLDFSREEVRLPFGVPRFINAATLRVIAGGRRFDQLLKKVDGAWEFVEDDTMIDLTNSAEQFRLGRLTIIS